MPLELLKSFEVDSSRTPLSSEVKSSRRWSSRPPSTWGHFSLKSGHVSVPQRLAGLVPPKEGTIETIARLSRRYQSLFENYTT